MTSPFALFRKNQKVMMVALIGMAMFSFVVLGAIDMSSQGGMEAVPAVMGMFLGGVICWIISAWIINQKTSGIISWTVCGCIAGVMLGSFAGGSFGGPSDIVKTKAGGLTRADIDRLQNQRALANGFVERALRSVYEDNQFMVFQLFRFYSFSFGQEQREDVVLGHVLQNEADKMGIAVDDSAVLAFITKITDSKLSRSNFVDIRRELGISESQLFDILRAELRAKQAFSLLMPSAEPTPETLWQYYRRLNLSQTCDVIPISVDNFEDEVKVPGDDKLKAFFEEHKTVFPGEEEAGSPGFKQPDRLKLASVQMSFEKVAESIPEISDEEILAYYEENKESYRSFAAEFPIDNDPSSDDPMPNGPSLSDPKSDDPMSDDSKPNAKPEDNKKTDDPKPESDKNTGKEDNEKTEKKDTEASKTESEEKTAGKPEESVEEKKPAEEKPEVKESEKKSTPEKENENSSSSLKSPSAKGFASLQDDPKEDEKPKSDQPTESSEKKDDSKNEDAQPEKNPEQKASEDDKPESKSKDPMKEETEKSEESESETPTDEGKTNKDTDSEKPETEEMEEKPENKPVYRPLEEVKDEIREQIKQERTFDKLNELASALRGQMRDLGLAHNLEKTNDEYLDAKQVAEALKKYATEKGFKYSETPYVSSEELTEVGRYVIGTTVEPGSSQASNPFEQPTFESTVDVIFATNPEQLYTPYDAEDIDTNDRFVYWKIGHKEEHVPEFDDKGVKKQVVSQWKKKEARSLTQERAQEIAKIIEKAGDKEIGEVIADMTETGEKEGTSLVVIGTGAFTWLSQSAAAQAQNPFAPRPISLTEMPSILGGASEEFMQIAFNEIEADGVGVAPNADRSIYFVVKVISRDDDETLRKQAMDDPAGGMFSSATQQILRADQGEIHSEFIDALKKQYSVEWIEEEENENSRPL